MRGSKLKSYNTLRGFLTGEESDEPIYFAHSATLRIFGEELDFEEIEHHLGLKATHTHRKGDKRGPRSPGFRHDMWSYRPPIPEERLLGEHIDALWSAIQHAEIYLLELKNRVTVDVFLGYRSNHDFAGVEVPYTSLEMFTRLEIPFGISIIITPLEGRRRAN